MTIILPQGLFSICKHTFNIGFQMRKILLCTFILAFGALQGAIVGASAGEPLTLSEALVTLPDHTRYRVELAPADMTPEQVEQLTQMVGDAARGQHFYGAVYSYRPASGGSTEYKMRSGLHSRDAARTGALGDCEAARLHNDGECILVGEILPDDWSEDTPPLSHVAVQALREMAGSLPGNVVVAISKDGDGFEIRSGDTVRDATLAACNEANAQARLPTDCIVTIDDLAGTN